MESKLAAVSVDQAGVPNAATRSPSVSAISWAPRRGPKPGIEVMLPACGCLPNRSVSCLSRSLMCQFRSSSSVARRAISGAVTCSVGKTMVCSPRRPARSWPSRGFPWPRRRARAGTPRRCRCRQPAGRRGFGAGEPDQRRPVRVVEGCLQPGEDRGQHRPQSVDPTDPVAHQVLALRSQHLQIHHDLIRCGDHGQIRVQTGSFSDRLRIFRVGLTLAGERSGHPVDQPSRHTAPAAQSPP